MSEPSFALSLAALSDFIYNAGQRKKTVRYLNVVSQLKGALYQKYPYHNNILMLMFVLMLMCVHARKIFMYKQLRNNTVHSIQQSENSAEA